MNKFSKIVIVGSVFAMSVSPAFAMTDEINVIEIPTEVEGDFSISYEYVNNSPDAVTYSNCNIWSYITPGSESADLYEDILDIGMAYEPMEVVATFPDETVTTYVKNAGEGASLEYGAMGIRTFYEFNDEGTDIIDHTLEPGEKVSFVADFMPHADLVDSTIGVIRLECINSNDDIVSSGELMVEFNAEVDMEPEMSEYPEDTQGHTFELFIEELIDAGVVSGYPDGTFKPDNDVTRGEFAKFVSKGFGLETDTSCEAFADVQTGHTFFNEITTLKCTGIVGGFDGNVYRSDQNITRAEAVSITMNAFFETSEVIAPGLVDDIPKFDDVTEDNPHYENVLYARSYGFVSGETEMVFNPDGNITRGATSKVIANARK